MPQMTVFIPSAIHRNISLSCICFDCVDCFHAEHPSAELITLSRLTTWRNWIETFKGMSLIHIFCVAYAVSVGHNFQNSLSYSSVYIFSDLKWLSITLVMIGKMCSSSAFSVVFLYASELNPTEIRSRGMSLAMMASRLGGFAAPFLSTALVSTWNFVYLLFAEVHSQI